jgi:hypothetical protein
MKLVTVLFLSVGLAFGSAAYAGGEPAKGETKDVKAGGKTLEVRVPKSAKINCKDKANADKTECKKQPKEMPKVEKPTETAPADAKKK